MNGAEQRWNALRSLLRARAGEPPLVPAPRTADLPASFAQEALWFLDRLEPNSTAYHLTVACRLHGVLDVPALERSLSEVVARHEILRTTLRSSGGAIVQHVEPARAIAVAIEDVHADQVESWASERAELPFELGIRPPFRVHLARLAPDDHCLVLALHHSIFDGWSFEVFMRELCALYGAFHAGAGSPLVAPALHYGDVAVWQRRCLTDERRDRLTAYWKARLDGELPVLRLPFDHPRVPGANRRGASQTLALPNHGIDALRAVGAAAGATLYVVLLAAFEVLLHRITGDEDLIVGSPFAVRRAELRDMIGMVTNTLPLRTQLGGRPTFRELLARVQQTVTGALAHQELPFELLARAVHVQQHSGSPLFRAAFALQNVPRSGWSWPGLRAVAWNVPPRCAKFDLTLTVSEHGENATALMEYDADRFDASTIARMLAQLSTLLGEVVRDPDRPIDVLPILDAAERHRLLTAWNDTTVPYPRDQPIHRIFESHARRAPDATALIGDAGRVRYDELDRRANQLARRLVKMSLGPEPLVAVLLDRSPALIVAQLAILKAGGAYVPVERSAAAVRRAAGVAAVVTDAAGVELAATLGVPVVRSDDPSLTDEPAGALDLEVPGDGLAYVMFTSGSSGAPRGVCVPHRGVVRLVIGATYARFASDEVFLQLLPASFDASTLEIWGALLHGATLVLAPARPLSITEIRDVIERHGVTTLVLTSGLFERFVDGGGAAVRSLRQLVVGGDVMSAVHAARFVREHPTCRLVNAYGPTENTTITTAYTVREVEPGRSVPIGQPIANTRVYVLDRHLEPVPLGVVGEAWTSGDGVARGYLHDEAATRDRFVASPFVAGEVIYRTGDLVRRRGDGVPEFVGRADDQVKIRGFRIEPRDIERALAEHERVRQVAVVAEATSSGGKRLVAFVAPDRPDDELPAVLRAFLRVRLPSYMVPAEIAFVAELPLTANGKPDRSALQVLPRRAPAVADRARDALEQRLEGLFSRLAGRERVGLHDSFFDIGGDSLAAVELAAAIERELGHALPLVTIFDQPTIVQLARELRAYTAPQLVLGPRVVQLKPGTTRQPLFLVPGGQGEREEAAICARLVARLRDGAAVLGLLAPRRGDSLPVIARQYVDDIQRLQPRGPYRIGGQCIGGVIAYEIAQQLCARGEPIELLLLIDAWCPTTAGVMYERLIGHPQALLRAGLAFLASLSRRPRDAEPWPLELWRRAFVPAAAKRHMRACLRYRPAAYPGEVTLLASDESLRLGATERWRALAAGGVVVHRAPGDHESCFRHHARETAECLRICLESHARRRVAQERSQPHTEREAANELPH